MTLHVRLERFRAFDVTVRNLQRQILHWVPGHAAAVGIEPRPVEVIAILVRFAAGENAALDFHIAPLQPGCRDAKGDVC